MGVRPGVKPTSHQMPVPKGTACSWVAQEPRRRSQNTLQFDPAEEPDDHEKRGHRSGRSIVSQPADNVRPEKAFCFDYLDRNAKAIATLNDSIFYFAELGMQETETSKLMSELLERGGFKVERGISGFASGFCATCGSGGPV